MYSSRQVGGSRLTSHVGSTRLAGTSHKRSKSRTSKFTNFEILLYFTTIHHSQNGNDKLKQQPPLVNGLLYMYISSVVGIATGYGLHSPGIKSRWGARFSAPVQTCPGAHPASCIMGTGSFPGLKCGRGVTLTPHPI